MNESSLTERLVPWSSHYRIIPSKYPPINFFENLVDSSLMDELYYIESLTNDRLQDEVGDIQLVKKSDRVSGPGSSYVMAAFTHPAASRFSNGTFGLYYASRDLITAIKETIYHTQRFLSYTCESQAKVTKRVLKGQAIIKKCVDIREPVYSELHHSEIFRSSRRFGSEMKEKNAWGILYRSVRHSGGENIAILRPNAIELPVVQTKHLEYHWDGEKIAHVTEVSEMVI